MKYLWGYITAAILGAVAWALNQFGAEFTTLVDMVYPYVIRTVQTFLAQWSSGVDFLVWQVLLVALEDAPQAFIRTVMASKAKVAMVPMQDVLCLGSVARMNLPGTIGTNWQWRMLPGATTRETAQRLRDINIACQRGK